MNFIKSNWQKIVFTIYAFVVPFSIIYANGDTCPAGTICNPLSPTIGSIPVLIQTILHGAIEIGIPIVALAIIYCGFLFVSARGKPEKLTEAKDALLWTLIGAAILLGAWAIAQMIQSTVTGLSG